MPAPKTIKKIKLWKRRLSVAGRHRTHTEEELKKMSNSQLGPKNHMWKGDGVGYFSLHAWVSRRLGRPKLCSNCKRVGKVDLANISGKYKRELSDWEWLCRKCHMEKDGRLSKLNRFKKGQDNWINRERNSFGRFI